MGTTETTSEAVSAWVDANWDLDMTLADWWQRLADAGYAFPHWPTGFGGCDLPAAEAAAIQQVLGANSVIGPPTGNAPNMGVPTILTHGTEE
ncbi:MAG: acyl-CoA dehydrogenase family protein, partial [Ilumatobacteraceae bacterium]